jgi:hypothetical protein
VKTLGPQRTLRYSLLSRRYAICKLPGNSPVPEWAFREPGFCSVTRTSDELSIVCAEEMVPPGTNAVRGWLCLKLEGPFAFSETGILSSFLAPLAESGVGIFAVSTFDTDYVLIQAQSWPKAAEALRAMGHEEAGLTGS